MATKKKKASKKGAPVWMTKKGKGKPKPKGNSY